MNGMFLFYGFITMLLAIVGYGMMIRMLVHKIQYSHRLEDTKRFSTSLRLGAVPGLVLCLLFAAFALIAEFLSLGSALIALLCLLTIPLLLYGAGLVESEKGSLGHRNRITGYLDKIGVGLIFAPFLLAAIWPIQAGIELVINLEMFPWPILIVVVPLAMAWVFLTAGKRRKDQETVLWTLAIAAHSGLPIPEELSLVSDGLSKKQRRRVQRLSDQLKQGVSLDTALEQTPGIIPHFAVLATQVGVQNGNLAESLRAAALFYSSREKQKRLGSSSISMGVLYLLIVPLIAVLIITGIMIYIIPKFKEIFVGFDTPLPEATSTLIEISDAFYRSPAWILFFIGVPAILMSVASAYCRGWGESNIPLIGAWFRRLDVPGLLRNLAATISAGGSLEKTLGSLAQTHRRSAVRAALTRVHSQCVSGADCWAAIRSAGLLTSREFTVVNSARRVGNLPWVLPQLADSIEKRFTYRWLAFMEFAQPAIVMLMGLGVGLISFALFLPILKLINDLS